jgi:phospholipid/cholesterol/gamma-HCH transport system permease protein
VAQLRNYFALNAQILYWIFLAPLRGKPRFRLSQVFHQMVRIGVQAVPMASMVAFSIGLTMAMQGAYQLSKFGASAYVPDLVSLTLLRELGPLLVGVVVIGRSGSAITAEIGTMKVSEEIEALQVMAINPIRFLIVPRFLAMLVMLPALTVFGNYVGFVGGWSICHFALDMNTSAYILRLIGSAHPIDLYAGIVKSFVFAWLIATIASQAGLEVTGGAEGVGQSTTSSVVVSIIAMLIANAALTAVFFFAAPS